MNSENNSEIIARIEIVLSKNNNTEREKEFLNSILGQAKKNYNLSSAQISWFSKIENKKDEDFSYFNWENADDVKKREYLILHYSFGTYYQKTIMNMISNPKFIPNKEVWDKMWGNVYVNAGYKRFSTGARYKVADMVINKFRTFSNSNVGVISKVNWINANWQYEVTGINGIAFEVEEKYLLPCSNANMKRHNI